MSPTLLWFRQDLRLEDNPALVAALERGGPILPIYIWDTAGEGAWAPGGASRWWLHHSLEALSQALLKRGSRLLLRQGRVETELASLCAETGARAVYWNRRYEPALIARDSRLKIALETQGVEAKSFNASLLFEPPTIANKQGGPFQVFTPFWRHCLQLKIPAPIPAKLTRVLSAPESWPNGYEVSGLGLLPRLPWASAFARQWTPGEAGARRALELFAREALQDYDEGRDLPSQTGTSRLSAHLHFGEISPRQVWGFLKDRSAKSGVFPGSAGEQRYLAELGWREFAHHLLYHFPSTPEQPLRAQYANFPWASDPEGRHLAAWQQGRTGYPIVDAGMRELWATGWMHNRVRMIVASFLVKHLRLSWQSGAAWFWDTLVDADLAANTLGWQWSAGCGADAAPYFRIFNPVLQGGKFDAQGEYVRRWVPELAQVAGEYLHRPWEAPPSLLARAGVELGRHYPRPIVDHTKARAAALAALKQLRA